MMAYLCSICFLRNVQKTAVSLPAALRMRIVGLSGKEKRELVNNAPSAR